MSKDQIVRGPAKYGKRIGQHRGVKESKFKQESSSNASSPVGEAYDEKES